MDNYFQKLNSVSVDAHIEKKGAFSYLSWPFAVAQLRLTDPMATWAVRRFDGLPYLKTETGYFVEVAVTVQDITLSQIHPVLDNYNHPIPAPTCFDINTSIQRALVKAIALHGLGLCVYAGEDLPHGEKATVLPAPIPLASISAPPTQSPATATQVRYLQKLIRETGSDLQTVLDYFRVSAVNELSTRTASRAIKSLEKHRRAA